MYFFALILIALIWFFIFKIFHEPVKVQAKSKVDAKKSDYVKPGGDLEVIKTRY